VVICVAFSCACCAELVGFIAASVCQSVCVSVCRETENLPIRTLCNLVEICFMVNHRLGMPVLCDYVIAALFAYFPKVCILHIFSHKLSLSPFPYASVM